MYRKKGEVALAWLDNRDQVRCDLRKLVRRLEDAVLDAVYQQFLAAQQEGRLLELRPGEDAIRRILAEQAKLLARGDT